MKGNERESYEKEERGVIGPAAGEGTAEAALTSLRAEDVALLGAGSFGGTAGCFARQYAAVASLSTFSRRLTTCTKVDEIKMTTRWIDV